VTTATAFRCLALLNLVWMVGCSHEPHWNVLLVTFDTTRADHLGCYGNNRIRTPALDGLAAQGVRFARATSAVPITAPSHATILTGRYPVAHGVRDNGLFILADEQPTLAEVLGREGYATAAAIGAYPLTARFGLGQGFDLFDDHLAGASEDYLGHRGVKDRLFFDERRAAQVNEAVLPWLSDHADGPFFLWVHYFDPHQPFEPPAPFDQLYADARYDGEIAYADSRLGFLLEQLDVLGALDDTLIVMTADHGEGLGEHNELTHAVLAYDTTLHVPLLIRPPHLGAAAGTVVHEQVGTVDVVPTVLDLLGIPAPEGLDGRSLAPLWRGSGWRHPPYYAENISGRLTHGWGELRILIDPPLKYIHGPRPELYDVAEDPHELRDLIEARPEDAARLRETLAQFLESNAHGASRIQELDPEVRARLAALGYLHADGPMDDEITEVLREDGLAPQDRVVDLNDLSAAKHLLFDGKALEALAHTRRLTQGGPESPLYLELHATALSQAGHMPEATAAMRKLADLGAVPERLMLSLAVRRFETGDASVLLDLRSYADQTGSVRVLWLLATLQGLAGESDVRATLERALAASPQFSPARIDLAVQLAEAGDLEEADSEFRRALEDGPYDPRGHYNYGTLLLQTGRYASARSAFERALALSPRNLRAHLGLVASAVAAGDAPGARAASEALQRISPDSEEAATAADLLTDLDP
jgi:arylsulfatase A-like enzyme/thioredoxin-like negative regulator of GroEL